MTNTLMAKGIDTAPRALDSTAWTGVGNKKADADADAAAAATAGLLKIDGTRNDGTRSALVAVHDNRRIKQLSTRKAIILFCTCAQVDKTQWLCIPKIV